MTAGATGPPGDSIRRAARGSALTLVGSGVSAVAAFAITIVVTRLTSPIEAGVFFSATSLFLLATALGRLGTNTGLVYFISRARAQGEPSLARAYMRVALGPVLIFSGITTAGLLVAAAPISRALSPERVQDFTSYITVMAFFVPLAAVANLAMAGTQGLGTMKAYAALEQTARPLLQLGLVAAGLAFIGPGAVPIAWSMAYLPLAVLAWWWWRRLLPPPLMQPAATGLGRPFWRFTAPRGLSAVAQMAMQRLDIILVGALAGLAQAAVYAAATRFLILGQAAARAISLSAQPLLGEALAREDEDDARSVYQVCTTWLVMGAWPLYLVLLGYAPQLLEVFGSSYVTAADALRLLAATMLVATACGMVDMVLNMAGKSLWNLGNVLVAFGLNLSVDLILIPRIGFLGAAIGWSVAILAANLLPLSQIYFSRGLHPFGRPLLVVMGASVVAFAGLPMLASQATGSAVAGLTIGTVAGLVLYVAVLYRLRRALRLRVLIDTVRRRGRGRGSRRREGPTAGGSPS